MLKKIFTGFIIASAAIYAFILYYMLFRGFGRAIPMVMLSEDMRINYANLIPFKTIIEYITDVVDGNATGNAIKESRRKSAPAISVRFLFAFLYTKNN